MEGRAWLKCGYLAARQVVRHCGMLFSGRSDRPGRRVFRDGLYVQITRMGRRRRECTDLAGQGKASGFHGRSKIEPKRLQLKKRGPILRQRCSIAARHRILNRMGGLLPCRKAGQQPSVGRIGQPYWATVTAKAKHKHIRLLTRLAGLVWLRRDEMHG